MLLGHAAERFSHPQVVLWSGCVGVATGLLALATRAFRGSREEPAVEREEERPENAGERWQDEGYDR